MPEPITKTVPNALLIGQIDRMLKEGHTATFRVKGYSMRLFLENERDVVKLTRVSPEQIKLHDVVLAYTTAGLYVLHRVIKREGNRLTLMGDGNVVGTEECTVDDVVGIAVAFYRKGRQKPDLVTGMKWKVYTSVWLTLKPLRRIILGVCRRLPFTL